MKPITIIINYAIITTEGFKSYFHPAGDQRAKKSYKSICKEAEGRDFIFYNLVRSQVLRQLAL